ncbi:hypothetical protein A3J32_00020 [Candidatus Saccharibacteria bacterium RIFCSPLOWO2_02_FULL_46_7]|nr:MAG: hypothetical protein A3J32_00020 [Candidatus Saccharibacteria bacterium RIFCSPLOWO2_02_FULL_46_7]
MKNINQFEIYWVNLDPVVGREIKKTRPAIIVSPDVMNKTVDTLIVVPLTRRVIDWPFRMAVQLGDQLVSAACDHIRSVSKKRLQNKIGSLNQKDRQKILALIQEIFA